MRPCRPAVLFAALLSTLALSGCARYTAPYKPGASLEDVTREVDVCTREIIAGRWNGDVNACMRSRGWQIREARWEKPGGTPETFEEDQKTCLAAPARTDLQGLTPGTLLAYTLRRCIEERGWKLRLLDPI